MSFEMSSFHQAGAEGEGVGTPKRCGRSVVGNDTIACGAAVLAVTVSATSATAAIAKCDTERAGRCVAKED